MSNNIPLCLALGFEGPRGRPAVPDDSGSCPRACEFDLHSWVTRARALIPEGSTSVPGELGPCLSAHGGDHLARETRRARGVT